MSIEIAGKVIEMELPAELQIDAATLTAIGNFELTHEALGLRPFSALLGSLRVAEQLDFTFRFTARREVP